MMEPAGEGNIELDIIRDDDDEWKKRRPSTCSRMSYLSVTSATSMFFQMHSEGHTRIMATLVPDEIIYNIEDYSKRAYETCMLFGDVSGFTDLCEKYNKSGKGGPSRLTQVLNNYIGAMVQEIMSHGGDVLSFSGDAFIALFKVTDTRSMRDVVHETIDCSLVIQKSYGTYQTDVDVVVRVKLAIACGKILFSMVGNEESSHYLMTGEPIDAIKVAEHRSAAGEIVITARVSRHLATNEYQLSVFADGQHAKVLGVGPNWRNTQRSFENKDYRHLKDLEEDSSVHSLYSDSSSMRQLEEVAALTTADQYVLRPAVNYAARSRLKDELKKFIITPVMRGIEASEPLEYLTEIRRVAILFLNCKVSAEVGPSQSIDIAHEVYVTVYNVVKDRFGCVNKMSNFDKDLMLLIIFGLRGFKHELECQIALKCARECFEKIKNIRSVLAVSAAVTTGSCYCGAFGHTLRREYTVIGLVVNKAARLMMAFPKMVTCDRETFLYSKLQATNFILQPYKPLKGIVNPGPIYEFVEVRGSGDHSIAINPLPLLGRELEMATYKSLIDRARRSIKSKFDNNYHATNLLLFRGDFRQGKTRLLEEILFTMDPGTPIISFRLVEEDRSMPYRTIQVIFEPFVGKTNDTVDWANQRQQKIQYLLQGENIDLLLVFNDIFKVRFLTKKTFRDENERIDLTRNMFSKLCAVCFRKFFSIVIDDINYADNDSWALIDILSRQRLIFMTATIGRQEIQSIHGRHLMQQEHVKIVDLRPIDNWHHVGLVCQMLRIDAISPELEKTVQKKSNGNPGWIESFLVTVLQSGGITVEEMTRFKAYKEGMVMPALYMLMRFTQAEMDTWVSLMEERMLSYRSEEEYPMRWNVFSNSCRESYPDLMIQSKFVDLQMEKPIQACLLNPNFNVEDVEPEYHIDTDILRTFDSLSSYEQLLLKCSSVLGDLFPRDMLQYIMASTSTRLIAMAVKKLFEIQVLSCAKGNFLDGGLNFKDRLIDPNTDKTIRCDCVGLLIEETCIDLPKYASCGYMRFRSSEFRETTYDLLTDNQKREFHGKAIRYMEKETRRCRSCGSGYFSRYLGAGRLDDGLRSRTKSKKYSLVTQDNGSVSERGSLGGSSHSVTSKTISSRTSEKTGRVSGLSSTGSISGDRATLASEYGSRSHFGVATIRKLKKKHNLVRTFSSYDYSQCTCSLILNTMYSQLIQHSKGAGLVEKIMDATIEYSYVCMENKNAPQAIKVLEEALVLLEGPMKEQIELDWMIDLKRAKLLALIGRAKLYLDDDEAYFYFMDSLQYYGINFPSSRVGRFLLKRRFRLKQSIHMFLFSTGTSTFDEDIAEYCNNVAECLNFLCNYFTRRKMWPEAELAALWSLSKALRTESDFEMLCRAYASMIYVASISKSTSFSLALEIFALRTCHMKRTIVEMEELKAVCLMYFHIGRTRLLRGETDKAMHMNFPIWRIATASKSRELLIGIFPLIAFTTLLKKQVVDYGNILNELLYTAEFDTNNAEKVWYHALSMSLDLETGFVAVPMQRCNQFIQSETFDIVHKYPNGKLRLMVCKWLWELRNENWEAATIWQKEAWSYKINPKGEKLGHIITGLYLLEGLIIFLVIKLDLKDYRGVRKSENLVLKLMKRLFQVTECAAVLRPRLYHLQGYYTMVKHDDLKKASKFLSLAKKLATKHHNDLELSWIDHNERSWKNKLSTEEKFMWQERCEEGNCVPFNDLDFLDKLAFFSLPLPIYV